MPRRQTTMMNWLQSPKCPGTRASRAIAISDDVGSYSIERYQLPGATVSDPIDLTGHGDGIDYLNEGRLLHPTARWPSAVRHLRQNENPEKVAFPDQNLGECSCSLVCDANCLNVRSAMYCHGNNCRVGALCGNRLLDYPALSLMQCTKGYGVKATDSVPTRTIVGEYCGTIVPHSSLSSEQVARGYVLQFKSKSTDGEPVFIDAYGAGSICRFVNHSCSPNSRFEERSCRRSRRMVLVSHATIDPGVEVTVKYNAEIRFQCICLAENCISKK